MYCADHSSYSLTRGDPSTVIGIVNCLVSIAAIIAVTYLGLQNEAQGARSNMRALNWLTCSA